MHTLESAQRTYWSALHIREAQIKLHDFIACYFAGVGYSGFSNYGIAGLDRRRGQRKSAIAEGGIAESIAEGIKRCAFEVAIGAALHRVVFKRRQLIHAGVERDGQAACWIVLA